MNQNSDSYLLKKQLDEVSQTILSLTPKYQGKTEEILLILRTLEQLHRDICQQWFEPSLPQTRQDLYHLLREIEETGGWPYIEKMKLRTIMAYLLEQEAKPTPT